MLLLSDKDFSSRKLLANHTNFSNAIMKIFLGILLSIVALSNAELDSYCIKGPGTYNVPHPTECTKFISCIGNIGTVQTCLDDKWFDKILGICMPISIARCDHVPVNDIPQYVLEICKNMAVGQQIPAIECNLYYVCYGTGAFELTCPNGTHYSRAHSACMNPLQAGCRSLNTMCIGKYPGFGFPSLLCENFYVCNNNLMPELQSCSSGLYFSPAQQKCIVASESGCVNDGPGSGCGTDKPIIPPPVCDSTNIGSLYPHTECNWFYMCFNLIAEEFQCQCGQYFDSSLGYCIEDTNKVCLK